ncbi:hypothetical protein CXG81DRAFT_13520 [Caulochytrium protostelioides]|uniref:Uncharacterized protein n=1 Tax=Caulochytrium protostelioides TaxID=1555241 RepID=A0A4P9X506_9FUNG|nr:hypothetical protein CXG81DRAFT_13520 [Caulochytrium protostelioides]|eukprot:RKP00186.1 hypothetical protein CXG81DRAFT_13520 [Caulochytrium protostelioides]
MIPTPDLAALKPFLPDVYDPAEDTFLLLDALEGDADALRTRHAPSPSPAAAETPTPLKASTAPLVTTPFIVEIGPGSGCVLAFLAALVGCNAVYWGVDMNPKACAATRAVAAANRVRHSDVVMGDLTAAMAARLCGQVDVLVFNPPYVPTDDEELAAAAPAGAADSGPVGIAAAWAGGVAGRVVIDRLMPQVKALLSPRGAFYLVVVRENRPDELARLAREQWGLRPRMLMERKAGYEGLGVMKFEHVSDE